MGNLDSLPVEIILKILKGFDIDSVIEYRLVSRSWNYPVYHRLLDYLRETQLESEQKLKEIKSQLGRLSYIKSIIGFVKRGIIDAQRNSGGPDALFGRTNSLFSHL
ncbi:hypothetical protein MKW98_001631 [Papaver atlanticum]|uniref:F-box domain-containing protein n=1 Tax=Papaver atlanticum TaxID=357466 RepID=A0AAD4S8X5_9MAGN|nr:hypothetical protein MKW98_001631 [Papaver atlanticum]